MTNNNMVTNPKRVISFRFDEDLLRDLRRAARADGRIFSAFVRQLLCDALKRDGHENRA